MLFFFLPSYFVLNNTLECSLLGILLTLGFPLVIACDVSNFMVLWGFGTIVQVININNMGSKISQMIKVPGH